MNKIESRRILLIIPIKKLTMNTSVKRTQLYRTWVEAQYQLTLQEVKNQLINTSYQRGPNHNYAYYLSLVTYLEKQEDLWKLELYRRYMAAYKIQQVWKTKRDNSH